MKKIIKEQNGFTLIEIMIALVIGAVITYQTIYIMGLQSENQIVQKANDSASELKNQIANLLSNREVCKHNFKDKPYNNISDIETISDPHRIIKISETETENLSYKKNQTLQPITIKNMSLISSESLVPGQQKVLSKLIIKYDFTKSANSTPLERQVDIGIQSSVDPDGKIIGCSSTGGALHILEICSALGGQVNDAGNQCENIDGGIIAPGTLDKYFCEKYKTQNASAYWDENLKACLFDGCLHPEAPCAKGKPPKSYHEAILLAHNPNRRDSTDAICNGIKMGARTHEYQEVFEGPFSSYCGGTFSSRRIYIDANGISKIEGSGGGCHENHYFPRMILCKVNF